MKKSLSGPESGRGNGGGETLTGKDLLIQKLVQTQGEITAMEMEIKEKKPGSRLRKLKQLVNAYNEALSIVFGKADAKRLVHYKVVRNDVEAYIPEPGGIPTSQEQSKKGTTRRKKIVARKRRGVKFSEADVNFDSDDVAYQLYAEQSFRNGEAKFRIYFREDIAVGTGYVLITDPMTQSDYYIPFQLKDDLTFVSLTTNLYLASGYPVAVVYHKQDIDNGLAGPKNDKSWLN